MVIRWDSESDWQNEQDSSGSVGRNGELKQGYSRQRPDLSTDLVGYWPLHDENATDYSGNNNHGTLNGGVTTGVAGKGGLQAMSFDGNDDWIDIPDQLLPNGSSLTLSFWFCPDTLGDDDRLVAISQSHECLANIGRSGNNEIGVRWRAGDGNARDYRLKTISGDTWYHYVVTYDSSKGDLKGYIDATEQLAKPNIGYSELNQSSAIGQKGGLAYYDGRLSDIRIYSRALTTTEINKLYRWGSGDFARALNDQNCSSTVSRWAFDGDATDSWGNNNGTVNGSLNFTDNAIKGQAANFDGNNDYIELPSNSSHNVSSDISISAWFKSSNSSYKQSIVHKWGSPYKDQYLLRLNNGNIDFYINDGSTIGPVSTEYTAGEWTFVTGVYDSSEGLKIYRNGVLKNYNPYTGGIDDVSSKLAIGGQSSEDRLFQGTIDDVRIYENALSPEEIFELYRWGTRGRDMRKQLVNY